jgi:hypothetical protein
MAVSDMINLSGLLDEAKCLELVRQHPAILIMPTNLSDISLPHLANPLCEDGFHGFARSYSGRIRPKFRNKTPK